VGLESFCSYGYLVIVWGASLAGSLVRGIKRRKRRDGANTFRIQVHDQDYESGRIVESMSEFELEEIPFFSSFVWLLRQDNILLLTVNGFISTSLTQFAA
jgi:hypothetical protein